MSTGLKARLKVAAVRLGKVTGAAVVAAVLGFLAGPDVASVVGTQDAVILSMILTPVLSGAEKALNAGLDPAK